MKFKTGDILVFHSDCRKSNYKIIDIKNGKYILRELVAEKRTFPASVGLVDSLMELFKPNNHPLTNIFER